MPHTPRTGPHDRGRLRAAAVAACVTAVGLAGCAAETGARDGGVAPRLSPPTSASPLWPQYSPPVTPTSEPTGPGRRYLSIKDVEVPAAGLKGIPVQELLEKDPNVPKLVQAELEACPGPECGLRKPVYRDLTGDGQDELVVGLDAPAAGLTLVQVYRAFGTAVRPVLISWGPLGLTGEIFGHDLVLVSTGNDGRFTTRYRWDGNVLSAAAPQDQTGDSAQKSAAPSPPPTETPPAPAPTPTPSRTE
ncbi:hypothetical protein OHA61_03280 [Streptomyces sp. NBC_00885]|uniref:hypothetical protein n=1 Tax=Streptomyces sp. NBC_00885 TaxID=2975857 RepID=UPI003869FE4C|nr:hypothetical protein OHA61_03280 [Streptomyces sp. NBC_00885]